MLLIGLSGPAGCGKDTVADYLVRQYGFLKFSFSDALYREVSEAFDVPVEELQDRGNKEKPHPQLTSYQCKDPVFGRMLLGWAEDELPGWYPAHSPGEFKFTPRFVLQRWGTEYRRAQDPEYWLKAADTWIDALKYVCTEDGEPLPNLVNTSVRFPNEAEFVREKGGVVWHLRRFGTIDAAALSGLASGLDHVAEQGLEVQAGDYELFNAGTVEQLHTAASLLLQAEDPEDHPGYEQHAAVDAFETLAQAPMKIVHCVACGALHAGVSNAYAEAEISLFNRSLAESGNTDASKQADVAEYHRCAVCGGTEFVESEPNEAGIKAAASSLLPVIFEGDK